MLKLRLSGSVHLTLDIQYVDANNTRITEFQYDWRGRQQFVIPPAVYTKSHYDNFDRVSKIEQYHEQSNSSGKFEALAA